MPSHTGNHEYPRTPQQELARAELLHRSFPHRPTGLAKLATARELAAHDRRADIIAHLHQQAAALSNMPPWQEVLEARLAKDAQHRKITAWLLAGSIAALVCGVVLLGAG
jgi:hypothetical protein